jgi:hypothetical protein
LWVYIHRETAQLVSGSKTTRNRGKGLFVFFACQTRLNERSFAQTREKNSVLRKNSL